MATNEKNTSNQTAPQGASSSARRRRRRSRHGGSAQPQNGTQSGAQATAAQPKKQSGSKAPASTPRQPAQNQSRRQNSRGQTPAKNPPAKAAQEPRSHRAPEPRRRAAAVQEDPGLMLITRRPPKQKFANFEEYIAAHGGITAPIQGEEEPAPAAAPEGDA